MTDELPPRNRAAHMTNKSAFSRLWLLATLIATIALVGCGDTSRFNVVITEDNVTVWDASGKGVTVPLEHVTIHGLENLPKPTPTPASAPTPTPWPTPAPLPTPVPGTLIDLDQSWTNPFSLRQHEGRQVAVTANLDSIQLYELGGWRDEGGDYVRCVVPENLSDNDIAMLGALELSKSVTFVGRLESDGYQYYLADCMPRLDE